MKAIELKERVQKSGSGANIADNVLLNAIERLEIMIENYAHLEHREFNKENVLLACGGGIAIGYDRLYDSYLNREASLIREDWDCYGNYDAVFALEWEKLKKEIERGRVPSRRSFFPDWRRA